MKDEKIEKLKIYNYLLMNGFKVSDEDFEKATAKELQDELDKLLSSGEEDEEIPKEIKCPNCQGEGQYYEGDDLSQCDECGGEGSIIIKEYAEAHGLTNEEAYYNLKVGSHKEEE